MPKDGVMPEHTFSTENRYMFYFKYGATGPTVIVEEPTSIHKNDILFNFLVGDKSEGEFVKKEDIIAVGDNTNGTVRIVGWGGKYRILNHQLFDKYLAEKVIELKKQQ